MDVDSVSAPGILAPSGRRWPQAKRGDRLTLTIRGVHDQSFPRPEARFARVAVIRNWAWAGGNCQC